MGMIAEVRQKVRTDLIECSWCNTFFDIYTREKVDVPEGTIVESHTICRPCKDALLADLRARK